MLFSMKLCLIFCISLFCVVLAEETRTLVFAQVIFRHGARAPSAGLTDPSLKKMFPRGMGELTDRGYDNSHKVGRFLAERYVDNGFLDKDLSPNQLAHDFQGFYLPTAENAFQMYWRSEKLSRCLATAATVGAAMFADAKKHLHPPITTEETKETLLNYDMNTCIREQEVYKEMCPEYVHGSYKTWPDFEAFIASCLNITQDPIFQNISFAKIESHINEYKNGIPFPELLETNKEKVFRLYASTVYKLLGVGPHFNLDLMKLKFGHIMRTLQENMKNAWNCYVEGEKCTKSMKKFIAYSSQDWILLGILESFGILNVTTIDQMPEYNTMIIMELWDNYDNHQPEVKVFYKKDEVSTDLMDVTEHVSNCAEGQEYCALGDFMSCCEQFWDDGEMACKTKNRKSKRATRKRDEKPKFFGPE